MEWNTLVPGCVDPSGVPTLKCLPALFVNLIAAAMTFAGVVALFIIIWGGYKFMTSGGDPKQLDTARKTLTYAIIGLIIVFLSFFIINFISTVTGVGCIKVIGFECK